MIMWEYLWAVDDRGRMPYSSQKYLVLPKDPVVSWIVIMSWSCQSWIWWGAAIGPIVSWNVMNSHTAMIMWIVDMTRGCHRPRNVMIMRIVPKDAPCVRHAGKQKWKECSRMQFEKRFLLDFGHGSSGACIPESFAAKMEESKPTPCNSTWNIFELFALVCMSWTMQKSWESSWAIEQNWYRWRINCCGSGLFNMSLQLCYSLLFILNIIDQTSFNMIRSVRTVHHAIPLLCCAAARCETAFVCASLPSSS